MNNRSKIIILILLIIAVVGMSIWKLETKKDSGEIAKEEILPADVLAKVYEQEITQADLDFQFQKLPKEYQDMFKDHKDEYLNQLIIEELLYQEATKRGFTDANQSRDEQFQQAIERLFTDEVGEPEVSDKEIEDFYAENKEQMPGSTLESISDKARAYLQQEKKNETFDLFIADMRENGQVSLNDTWMAEQIASRPKNPLDELLTNGLPTVLDLGSDSCIPCKMMKPIFAELETELADKANILILNVSEYSTLADKYNVRVIPTQIFFDVEGKQYWRHEGFLAKEDILKKLEESGAEL